MFLFKSRFFDVENLFFHVEIFISSGGFYLMSRVFSFRHFSFQEEIFVLLEVFQVDISQFMVSCYPGVLVGISWQ